MAAQKVRHLLARTWRQWRGTLILIVFVIVPVKSSLADFNWVPTGSMNPTILEGDLLFVNKLAYDLRVPFTLFRVTQWSDPRRGDIVICFSPEDGTRLVKRVIGLPGDTISMQANRLLINGSSVPLSAVDPKVIQDLAGQARQSGLFAQEDLPGASHAVMAIPSRPALRTFGPVTVPQGAYFVMGDNRDNSKDSRFFGFVPRKAIVGRAVGIMGSLDIKDRFQPRLDRFLTGLR